MQVLQTARVKEMAQRHRDFELINVLPEESFRKEHIPDSLNIPVEREDFESRVEATVSDKDQKIVVYCEGVDSDASSKAAKKLEAAGFSNVQEYEAGLKGWKAAGLPVQSGT